MATVDTVGNDLREYLRSYENRELLRFLTCGSVDDGKSTLIGRLLHDSASVYDDQMAALRKESIRRGTPDEIDLSLLVDGLEAEREQGITIDVAYRYFSTPKRKFIIADTPGHEQYTRNMATGASTCNLAVILVDARLGVLDQTRRHAFITSLLGIKHLVVAVNKMDLVGYSQEIYENVRKAFSDFAAKLQVTDIEFIPVSALRGDNIVHASDRMPWYQGRPLLDFLETVHIASDRNLIDLRFPVQYVLRPDLDFRGYCGTIGSGVLRRGDEVLVLPTMSRSRVKSIVTLDRELDEAFAPMSVTVTLEDNVDVSRGDMLVHVNNVPQLDRTFEAMLVWMHQDPLQVGREYLLKQTTVQAPAVVSEVRYRMDINTLHREDEKHLEMNSIGRVRVETPRALAFDEYAKNPTTGAFILIDRISNATVGAGMIVARDAGSAAFEHRRSADAGTNVRERRSHIEPAARAERLGQKPAVIWLTGLPRSGKTSIAYALEQRLFDLGFTVQVLDGETLRRGANADLGFSVADRREAARRTAEIAHLFATAGLMTIVAQVTPAAGDREAAAEVLRDVPFLEVYCNAPLEVCESRDVDGLYARARAGEIRNVTGIDLPYEPPASPDVELRTDQMEVVESVDRIINLLTARNLLPSRN